MSAVLDPPTALKRKVLLICLSLMVLGSIVGTIMERLMPAPDPFNLIVPPLFGIAALLCFIRLYRQPESLQQVGRVSFLGSIFLIGFISLLFSFKAFSSPAITLIDTLPPVTSVGFPLMMGALLFLHPRRFSGTLALAWGAIAIPILTYLFLHPAELNSPRGLELVISLGPVAGAYIALFAFYIRLQNIVDRLYRERLQYYSKAIERQAIRQQAMEQAFSQIHNGPLQTLALLQREIQAEPVPTQKLLQRLSELNEEIRLVGRSLTEEGYAKIDPAPDIDPIEPIVERSLRLGEGSCIDLDRPLHSLLHEVYALTLNRKLPYFEKIRVKVRNFAILEQPALSLELKRDLCLWLEEALCNIGKHAQGTTRIVVTGQLHQGHYVLKVQDNGAGQGGPDLKTGQGQQGTKQSDVLAQRLAGQFRRETLSEGGTICEISWPVEDS